MPPAAATRALGCGLPEGRESPRRTALRQSSPGATWAPGRCPYPPPLVQAPGGAQGWGKWSGPGGRGGLRSEGGEELFGHVVLSARRNYERNCWKRPPADPREGTTWTRWKPGQSGPGTFPSTPATRSTPTKVAELQDSTLRSSPESPSTPTSRDRSSRHGAWTGCPGARPRLDSPAPYWPTTRLTACPKRPMEASRSGPWSTANPGPGSSPCGHLKTTISQPVVSTNRSNDTSNRWSGSGTATGFEPETTSGSTQRPESSTQPSGLRSPTR